MAISSMKNLFNLINLYWLDDKICEEETVVFYLNIEKILFYVSG